MKYAMNDVSHIRVMQQTGLIPSECQCSCCQSQCKTPCLGTPSDILRLIQNGFADSLKPTLWFAGILMGCIDTPILMVQLDVNDKGCVMYRNGVCDLHYSRLKPLEGKLSNHKRTVNSFDKKKSIAWNIAKEWMRSENLEMVAEILIKLKVRALGVRIEIKRRKP